MVFVSKRVKFSKFRFFLGNFLCFYPLSFFGFGSRNTIQLCKSSFQHCVGCCSRVVELSGGARCSSSYFAYHLSLIVLRPIIAVLGGRRLLLGEVRRNSITAVVVIRVVQSIKNRGSGEGGVLSGAVLRRRGSSVCWH